MPRKSRTPRPRKKAKPLTARQAKWAADNVWRIPQILARWPKFYELLGYDEAYSIAQEVIAMAARHYKKIKGMPATYLTRSILRKLAYHARHDGVIVNKGGLPREELPQLTSMDIAREDGDDKSRHDVIAAPEAPERIEDTDDWLKATGAMKAVLTQRMRFVLTEHYLKGRSMKEIGQDMGGISTSRVWQICDDALARLRRKLKIKLPA